MITRPDQTIDSHWLTASCRSAKTCRCPRRDFGPGSRFCRTPGMSGSGRLTFSRDLSGNSRPMKVPTTASEQSGRHFGVENIREIQLSKPDVLDALSRGRELFTLDERKRFLIRSIALKADALT